MVWTEFGSMFRLVVAILISTFALFGCGSLFQVEVNGYSAGEIFPNAQQVLILPGNTNIDPESFEYKEYKAQLSTVMQDRGYVLTESRDDADLYILFSYSIDGEAISYSYTVPTYGAVPSGGATATVYDFGSISTVDVQQGTTVGVTGQNTYSGTRNVYHRAMGLIAFDADEYRATGQTKRVWQLEVQSDGSTNNLREVMPYLIAGAEPHIGTNTGKPIKKNLSRGNKRATQLSEL
jgi:hypothetical protein